MANIKDFEERCFTAFKASQKKAEEFEGPIGDIVRVPVKTQAHFEYCNQQGIDVYEDEVTLPNGYVRKVYCFYLTFDQAIKAYHL